MFRAPSPAHLPPFDLMCQDLGLPPAKIARYLGVTERTLRRWQHRGAPRAAHLALYWESRFGMSALEAERGNLIAHYHALAGMHAREVARLRGIVAKLEAMRQDEAANAPFLDFEARSDGWDSDDSPARPDTARSVCRYTRPLPFPRKAG